MAALSRLELKANDLRWKCDPDKLGFETTDELTCCSEIIGQDRALNAIKLGLEVRSEGYNIFVSGLTGTGRSTTIQRLLRGMDHGDKELLDICYVYNFQTPDIPICICPPAGTGAKLKKNLKEVLRTLRTHIPKALQSDPYKERQKAILEDVKKRRAEFAVEFDKAIEEKGFQVVEVQYGPFTRPEILPVVDGTPTGMDKVAALVDEGKMSKEDFEKLREDHSELVEKMEAFLASTRELEKEYAERISELEKECVVPIARITIDEAKGNYQEERILNFLENMREYLVDNIDIFKTSEDQDESDKGEEEGFIAFEVNVVVDNARTTDVPVITETTPSYANVFGTIERISDARGEYRTDFTKIRAGSLLRANGGFLVLNLNDLLYEPAVWPALKRALKNQQVTIQGFDAFFMLAISALKPEPINIDVKVVLIGDAYSYQILYNYDEEFRKIFKVKADFDNVMENEAGNLAKYTQFIKYICDEEKLLPFHKTGAAALVEEGVKIAGRQDKLSTRFSDIADVIREASYWAEKDNSKVVEDHHVEKAIDERTNRVNLIEDKIQEMIEDGTILLDIDGEKIGQVNGLSVYDLGDHSFGKPARITAEAAIGRAGIINIEREADLSGRTHNKGVLIIEGYLRRKYAQDKPLTMSASICFEQSYSGIDGDSASSTEIYALLSSLSEIPLRQDLAVTGSVNQKGEIQPIGGVNQKIEGFFEVCKAKGLTGKQGVIIPSLNKRDLMLRKDVIKAIESGKFHIYAIDTIDQGVELLSGRKAGKKLSNGKFEKDSVNALVDEKLKNYADQIREFYESEEEKG
ncbi:MAG: AAA family ATPase [Candidatus Latescibacteria bacterium]|nr:AAA family ATPase [Candidatus Latescibacterota bacterium]NIM21955.1 AAA family ATPase [Candidatus Latescibacterota bacterium]NIM65973.1 AAA family ATPase [Candidatus Latescibacterota bacterium]NIO02381.1 AAA family ATPase [Candidatus Latescibacterota bacterium]NIO29291.1 AAA family ATPase [Candidatus Latescibacterota bacterium]